METVKEHPMRLLINRVKYIMTRQTTCRDSSFNRKNNSSSELECGHGPVFAYYWNGYHAPLFAYYWNSYQAIVYYDHLPLPQWMQALF
jgi:hypothetical protein